MKRAGLDNWPRIKMQSIEDLDAWLEEEKKPFFFFSSKAQKIYTEASFTPDSLLIFGSETDGLPEFFWQKYGDHFYTIPMVEGHRCLNLASSAAIVLYEALRQTTLKTKTPIDLSLR